MALATVTVTWNELDIGQGPLSGYVSFQLSAVEADSADGLEIHPEPARTYFFVNATGTSDPLVANDNVSLIPAGSYYQVTVAIAGLQSYTFKTSINHANGASQTLAFLYANQAQPVAQYAQYLPLPSGTAAEGDVPVATGSGSASAWGSVAGTGTVTTVSVATANGFAGTVAAPTSAPALTLETTVTGLLKGNGTAVSPASAGTDYLAPNGNGSALTGITPGQVGADASGAAAAVLATSAQKASNLGDLANAGTARTNLGLGSAATHASTDFDAAGAAAAAAAASVPLSDLPLSLANGGTGQTAQQAALDALAGAVTSGLVLRGNGTHVALAAIQAADVPTLNQNTSGTAANLSGTPALPNGTTATTQTAADNSTKLATTAYADNSATTAASGKVSKSGDTMTGYLAPDVATLSFVGSGTTLVNAALGNAFNLTLTASTTTLGNPSNPVDGQVIRFRVTQGSGGSFTLAYASAYDFGAAGSPTLTTTAAKVDILGFEYVASISKWCYLGSGLGF